MLEQAERHRVLKHLSYFCSVGFLPLQVDVNSWEIHPGVRSNRKRNLCQISFAIYCSHGVFQALSLLRVVIFLRTTPLFQLILHMILVIAYAGTSFWYYLLYIKHPAIHAALVGMTLTGAVDGRTYTYCLLF